MTSIRETGDGDGAEVGGPQLTDTDTAVATKTEPAPTPETASPPPAEATPDIEATEVHPRPIRWMHWFNVPLLALMVWSGFRIYWAEPQYAFGIGSREWFKFFPQWFNDLLHLDRALARGIGLHFTVAWLLVANGLVYVTYLIVKGGWRRLAPGRRVLIEAPQSVLHDLHLRKDPPPNNGLYNAAQRAAYTVVVIMGILIVATGFAIYKPTQLGPLPEIFGGYQSARRIHFICTMGFVVFFFIHIFQVARSGWPNLRAMMTGYVLEPVSGDEEVTS